MALILPDAAVPVIGAGGMMTKDWYPVFRLLVNQGNASVLDVDDASASLDALTTRVATLETLTATQQTSLGTLQTNVTALVPAEAELVLANGDNNDVTIADNVTLLHITGPSAGYALTGIVAPTTARRIIVFSTVVQILTLKNQNASSAAANRIMTMTGSDQVMTAAGGGGFGLVYSLAEARWVMADIIS